MPTRSKLTDRRVEALIDHSGHDGNPLPAVFHDSIVPGLKIRIGAHKRTWFYHAEYQRRGKRGVAFKRLGHFPHMNVDSARRAALQEAAKVAAGRPQPGVRTALTLQAATDDYIESLRARGKKSAHPIRLLLERNLLPDFGRFTLAELSDAPALIRDHHLKLSKTRPVSANRTIAFLNAIYRHAARLDRSLPPASPISAVRRNKENAKQSGIPFNQFAAWRAALEKLPKVHRGYHLLLLLTGMRSAGARGLRWSDIDLRRRLLTIKSNKGGDAYSIPLTSAIVAALKVARPVTDGLIFPKSKKWNDDDLPYRGNTLRHSYITLAEDLNVNDASGRVLVGHSLQGVHPRYIHKLILEGGPGLKAAQRKIGKRICDLLDGQY